MSTCSRCQRTVGYDCDCTPYVQCCVCGRSMTADQYQCDEVDGEASCPSCAEQARRGDFLVEQGAAPVEPLRTRSLGDAVVAHPSCPSCGRPVLTLIKSTNPDIARRRFVVHQGSGRCMVSPADYAQLADWFARIFTDGARRARSDAAILAEREQGSSSSCTEDVAVRTLANMLKDRTFAKPIAADGYPEGWPRCAAGCGRARLDGHLTCGDAACGPEMRWR